MSIEKTPSGKWRVRVDIGRDSSGKRKRKTKVVPTKREAQVLEHMWSEMARTDAVVRDTWRFEDFVYEVYLPAKCERIRHSTLRRYQVDIRVRLMPAFGHLCLEDITKPRIQAMIDACSSHKTARTSRDTLRTILNYAIELGYLKTNSAALHYIYPERTVYPEDHNGVWLTTFKQHDDFISRVSDEPMKLMCVLGLSLGLRKGEIFGLDWEDVDLDKRMVHVRQTYVHEVGGHKLMSPKTRRSDRYIPLRREAAAYLRGIYEARGHPSGAICVTQKGKRTSADKAARRWATYIKNNDLPAVTILNMRHSFATACLNAGLDVTKVSRMLGHTQISTTVDRYVRYRPDDLRDDFDKCVGQIGDR